LNFQNASLAAAEERTASATMYAAWPVKVFIVLLAHDEHGSPGNIQDTANLHEIVLWQPKMYPLLNAHLSQTYLEPTACCIARNTCAIDAASNYEEDIA
jgi:hypothetical protein